MIKRIHILIVLLYSLNFSGAEAQGYRYYNGLGLRFTVNDASFLEGIISTGISFKRFTGADNNSGFEAIVSYRLIGGGLVLTGLFIKQQTIHNSQLQVHLEWYYGLGMHVTNYYKGNYRMIRNSPDYFNSNQVSIGPDAMIGIEYQMASYPFTIGTDIKPSVDLFFPTDCVLEILNPSVSVRYAF